METNKGASPFRKPDPLPAPSSPVQGARTIDVAGMIRQASTLVSVGQLIRNGKKDIHLLSRDKIDELISRALRTVVERYRVAGALADPALQAQVEADSRREFSDLLGQQQEISAAGEDLARSRSTLEAELRQMRADLAQQKVLGDGRLPKDIEKAMLERRFDQLCRHLDEMDRALSTLFSSRLYTHQQLQDLLRRGVAARKAAAVKDRSAPFLAALHPVTVLAAAPPVPRGNGHARPSLERLELDLGRGLDVGTVNIRAAARNHSTGAPVYTHQRNAFLDVPDDESSRRSLRAGIDYVVRGDRGVIFGAAAIDLATTFDRTIRRPMRDGMISAGEAEAVPILGYLVGKVLGPPRQQGEICVYSLPGDLLDSGHAFIYHRGALETAISSAGYAPRPMLGSHLVVAAELREQDYTGIGATFGGGTVNVCLAYKGVPTFAFSTMRGGNWIDESAAAALGMPVHVVRDEKEGGMDLGNPKGRVQEALAIYTRHFLQHTAQAVVKKMNEADHAPTFAKPAPLVCAGGGTMVRGFLPMLREEFDRVEFPFDLGDLSLAGDPLHVVAKGCLQVAADEMHAVNAASPEELFRSVKRAAGATAKKERKAAV